MSIRPSTAEIGVVESNETYQNSARRNHCKPLQKSKISQLASSDSALALKIHRVKVLILVVLVFLVSLGWLSYRNLQAATQSAAWEADSRLVIQEFGELLSSLKEAETGQRGFIITGNQDYLEPYNTGIVETWAHLSKLRLLTADNSSHQERLDLMTRFVTEKFAELKETIALRQTQGFAAAQQVVVTDAGRHLMVQLQLHGNMAVADEQKLLEKRVEDKQMDVRFAFQSVLICASLGTLALFLMIFYTRWRLASQLKLDAAWHASESRYAHLFNSITQGFCSIEKRGGHAGEPLDFLYLQANPAFLVQTGLSHSVVGKTLREVLPQEYGEWLLIYDNVLRTGKSISFERALIAQARVLELHAFRVEDQTHQRVGVSFMDITQRHQAQAVLRAAEERYRNLFNSIDEGFATLEVLFDASENAIDYRVLEVNPAFEKQTGLLGAAGKLMSEIVPDHDARWPVVFAQVALTGKPVRYISESKTLDGRWFDGYAMPLGEPTYKKIAVLFKDITKQIESDRALRQSAARFRTMFDHGPVAMYSVDAWGTIQEFNRHAVVLWGREPIRGDVLERYCGSFKLYRPDGSYLPHGQTPVVAILEGAMTEAHDVEVLIERPDGSKIIVILNVVPLKNDQGEITGAISCIYDITERSQLERKTLEQAKALSDLDRRKDEFLAMLSHELRNPLAGIFNAMQLLRRQKNEDPLLKQGRGIIERQVKQLNFLVNDLMEMSRFNTGTVVLRRKQISISKIVERAIEAARPLIRQRRQSIEVCLPQEPVFLYADARRIMQVLVNLLTNAAKYTDHGGSITLTVEHEDDFAVLRVCDTGIGIAPDLLPHIFELFTQAQRSLDRSQGGLGIGLCLVKQLVELHGGLVTVRSDLGQGSEFVVRLPLMDAASTQAFAVSAVTTPEIAPTPSPQASDSVAKSLKVLVVDDNVDAAHSLAVLLEMCGHQVKLAYDGPTATQAALTYQPDVVLLDIGLPGLDGYQVAHWIRQQASLKDVLLIAVTGYGQDSDRQHSKDVGFDHHLVKPVDFNEVEQLLANAPKFVS